MAQAHTHANDDTAFVRTGSQYVWFRRARVYGPVIFAAVVIWSFVARDEVIPIVVIPQESTGLFAGVPDYPAIRDGGTLERGEVRMWPTRDVYCAAFNGRQWKIDELIGDADAAIAGSSAVQRGILFSTVERLPDGKIELSVPGHGPIAYLVGVPSGAEWPMPESPDKCGARVRR